MRDNQTPEQLKIELLSQWKLEAESRKMFKKQEQSTHLNCRAYIRLQDITMNTVFQQHLAS